MTQNHFFSPFSRVLVYILTERWRKKRLIGLLVYTYIQKQLACDYIFRCHLIPFTVGPFFIPPPFFSTSQEIILEKLEGYI